MAYIGGDHLLITENKRTDHVWSCFYEEEVPNLVLLEAWSSAGPPAAPREVRFVCGPRYRGMRVKVIAEVVGPGDPSGVVERDMPLYSDPSRRVFVLLFYPRSTILGGIQGALVVHSETFIRLAREQNEGVVEWDAWEKFTVALGADKVSDGVDQDTKYSVSGSRLVVVDAKEAEGRAKVRVYDLSHWSRQHPDTRVDGGGGLGGGNVRCWLSQTFLTMPDDTGSIRYATMVHDSMVFFRVSHSTPYLGHVF